MVLGLSALAWPAMVVVGHSPYRLVELEHLIPVRSKLDISCVGVVEKATSQFVMDRLSDPMSPNYKNTRPEIYVTRCTEGPNLLNCAVLTEVH